MKNRRRTDKETIVFACTRLVTFTCWAAVGYFAVKAIKSSQEDDTIEIQVPMSELIEFLNTKNGK